MVGIIEEIRLFAHEKKKKRNLLFTILTGRFYRVSLYLSTSQSKLPLPQNNSYQPLLRTVFPLIRAAKRRGVYSIFVILGGALNRGQCLFQNSRFQISSFHLFYGFDQFVSLISLENCLLYTSPSPRDS